MNHIGELSFTNAHPLLYVTRLTLHVAAPVELAVAPFYPLLLDEVVPPATAQIRATVGTCAGAIAEAPGCPLDVQTLVLVAEIRRFLVVEQVVRQVSLLLVLTGSPLFQS